VEDCALVLDAIKGEMARIARYSRGINWDAKSGLAKAARRVILKSAFERKPDEQQEASKEEPAATPEEQKKREERRSAAKQRSESGIPTENTTRPRWRNCGR